MIFISKSTAAITLLFCFLSINFHNFTHFNCHDEEAENNFPDSRENEQHNISEQCDECLNKEKTKIKKIKVLYLIFILILLFKVYNI